MDSKIDNEEGIFRKVKCGVCRKRVAARLCDFVVDYRQLTFFRDYHDFSEQQLYGTCDMPLCDECAKRYNNIYDFCPFHYELIKKIQPTPEMKRAITEYVTKDLLNF